MSEGLYSMEAKDYDKTLDLTKIKPYGDTTPCPYRQATRPSRLPSS